MQKLLKAFQSSIMHSLVFIFKKRLLESLERINCKRKMVRCTGQIHRMEEEVMAQTVVLASSEVCLHSGVPQRKPAESLS